MEYKDYSKSVQHYMKSVEEYLTRRYGKVQNEWVMSLSLLADNLETYLQCKKAIKENGIFDPSTGRKSPLLSTMKDLNATIFKMTQKLGITPYDAAKIKVTEEDDGQLLLNLMGEED